MAFLSHLKLDHEIVYTFQRMTTEAVRVPSTSSKTVQNQKSKIYGDWIIAHSNKLCTSYTASGFLLMLIKDMFT
jgi:hypothetical protein